MMQHNILSSVEKLTLLSVIEKLLNIHCFDQFMEWIDNDLKNVFPHKTFVCGTVDIQEKPIVVKRLLCRDFPIKFFDYFRQPGGLISTPCMRQWAKTGEPQLYDLEKQVDVDPVIIQRYRQFEIFKIASHGARSIDGDNASYFSFVGIPGELGPRHAYLLKLLVPHMHEVLVRVAAVELNADVPNNPAFPGVTKREREVLRWMASGKSNVEIAEILGTSPDTVKNQASKIFEKLQVSNRAQAVCAAAKLRMLPRLMS